MNRTFVLFDRETESVWFPGKGGALNAVSGPRKGDSLPPVAYSEITTLGPWLKKHPESKILQPTPHSKTVYSLKRQP
jgi:hypothetical protein